MFFSPPPKTLRVSHWYPVGINKHLPYLFKHVTSYYTLSLPTCQDDVYYPLASQGLTYPSYVYHYRQRGRFR